MTLSAWTARFGDQLSLGLEERARCRRDGSDCEGSLPDAVLRLECTEDALAAVGVATSAGTPLTVRGGGSGRVGGALPRRGGVVLDTSGLDELRFSNSAPHPGGRSPMVVAGAGVRIDALDRLLHASGHWLPARPWGAPLQATVGGLIASAAAGPFARRFGDVRDHVAWLRVVTGAGEVVRVGCEASGAVHPDLLGHWVGSEGRLGVITEVGLRPCPLPPHRVTVEVSGDPNLDGLVEGLAADPNVLGFAWVDAQTARLWGASQDLLVLPRPVAVVTRHLEDPSATEGPTLPLRVLGPDALEREITRVVALRHPGALLSRVCPRPVAGCLSDMVGQARAALGKHRLPLYVVGDALGTAHLLVPVPAGDVDTWTLVDDVLEEAVVSAVDAGGVASGAFGVGIAGERFVRRQRGLAVEVLARTRAAWDPRGLFA